MVIANRSSRPCNILSQEKYFGLIFLAPALVIIVLLTIYPIINIIYTSLHQYSYIQGTKNYVGFENFIRIVNDKFFLVSLRNTFEFAVLSTFSELLVGLGLALLFKDKFFGRRYLLPIVIMPMLLSTMVVCATWRILYHYDYGLVNYILRTLELGEVRWLTNKNIVMKSIVLVEIWQWAPLSFLILLAGLQSIPQELYEAAKVDGAIGIQVLWHITLPLLKPHVVLVLLLRSIDTFKIFDKVYALTGGGPGNATETISYYIYREGFTYFHLGRASAASVIMLLISAAISLIYIRFIFREQAS